MSNDIPCNTCSTTCSEFSRSYLRASPSILEHIFSICRYTRRGSSELSYFLPSRGDGVNDMYVHLGFRAPKELLERDRLQAIWAIERARHPLLSARIVPGSDVGFAEFEYSRPGSAKEALGRAGEELDVRQGSKDELLDTYLNGPRLLSASRTSFLIVAREPGSEDEWHLVLCAMHCIGDGMALHACANDMLLMLGSGQTAEDLEKVLGEDLDKGIDIPRSMEASLPELKGRFKNAAAKVDEGLLARKQIGGQAFPRVKGASRKTVVPTVSFDEARTRRILAKCKANGVSVSNVVFALCSIAWAKMLERGSVTAEQGAKLPELMYTALNTRSWQDQLSKSESFFRLCIGYFNVILPSFIPSTENDLVRTFWHRARLAKIQSTKAVKSPFVLARTHLTATKRAEQSVVWARIDDQAEESKRPRTVLPTPATTPAQETPPVLPEEPKQKSAASSSTKAEQTAPSTALMGLSLLGNLDATYKHAMYGDIKLHSLTTGSRQRAGAMLLFSYTFAGKLWLCFGYDQNGFAEGVVEEFWKEVLGGVDIFLGL
ncbi:hypothetical protein BDV93DRAFT_538724 [Ceratobasidium sp. AG-I]|nr:hypothetical protein BDV93DRAFT_538724 [Ceratobasidium sp. AG-I]